MGFAAPCGLRVCYILAFGFIFDELDKSDNQGLANLIILLSIQIRLAIENLGTVVKGVSGKRTGQNRMKQYGMGSDRTERDKTNWTGTEQQQQKTLFTCISFSILGGQ
jgi:hypothetical protein